jgi:hypothetical protein
MALNATRLSTAMFAALTGDGRNGFTSPMSSTQQDMIRAWCDAIATTVVAEITGHAAVTVTSVTGVTAGPGVSGPGTGTVG